MGHLRKPEVRGLAKRHGLPTAETPESQDACLVAPSESFAEMLRARFAAPARPGAIVDEAGHVVGEHAGIHAFTIGQRKGLPAGARARRWVKAISPESGQVTVTSDPRAILGTELVAKDVNWLAGELPTTPLLCSVQVRYRHASEPARAAKSCLLPAGTRWARLCLVVETALCRPSAGTRAPPGAASRTPGLHADRRGGLRRAGSLTQKNPIHMPETPPRYG